MKDALAYDTLIKVLASAFDEVKDRRAANKRYSLRDILLAGFSVFYMQSPSFLSWQRDMEKRKGKSNLHTLLSCDSIPSDEQIKNVLDGYSPDLLKQIYRYVIQEMRDSGVMEKLYPEEPTLIALDGMQYHHSKSIHCEQCNTKQKRDGIHYQHHVMLPVIVTPESKQVLALEPEFVLPQDGSEKQDCETNAAKRWLQHSLAQYDLYRVIILADDLYCRQPMCEAILSADADFILVCKPESHKTLYAYLEQNDIEENKTYNPQEKSHYHYRYADGVPLRKGDDALPVHWCEITVIDNQGIKRYHNTFATSLPIDQSTTPTLCRYARARWKVENEANNTLKTKGYNFEHNFGHGKQHLAAFLLSLTLIAFLFHTIFDLLDDHYRAIREALGRRDTFFHDIRALTRYHLFDSWRELLLFMMKGLEIESLAFDSS